MASGQKIKRDPWIPLGSAQIIDWTHLGDSPGGRGATAWVSRIELGPVLLRSWCNDGTIFYEFHCLAGNLPRGTIVLSSTISEDQKTRLKLTIDVEGRFSCTDITDFVPHVTTGLLLLESRTTDVTQGSLDGRTLPAPTSEEARLFARTPEEVLTTSCGRFLREVIDCVTSDGFASVAEGRPRSAAGRGGAASEPRTARSPEGGASGEPRTARSVSDPRVSLEPRIQSGSVDARGHGSGKNHGFEPELRPRPIVQGESRPRLSPIDGGRSAEPIPSPAAVRSAGAGAGAGAGASRGESASPGRELGPLAPAAALVPPSPASASDQPRAAAVDRRRAKLTCTANTGESWDVNEPETFIGRSKQCGIILRSQRVSRKHASITQESDGYYMNDLGAANGVWSGTEKIDRVLIRDGAEYIVGDVLLTFRLS